MTEWIQDTAVLTINPWLLLFNRQQTPSEPNGISIADADCHLSNHSGYVNCSHAQLTWEWK